MNLYLLFRYEFLDVLFNRTRIEYEVINHQRHPINVSVNQIIFINDEDVSFGPKRVDFMARC